MSSSCKVLSIIATVILASLLLLANRRIDAGESPPVDAQDAKLAPVDMAAAARPSCCYPSNINLVEKFDKEYNDEKGRGVLGGSDSRWTDEKYSQWQEYLLSPQGQALTNVGTNDCRVRWNQNVLFDSPQAEFQDTLLEMMIWGETRKSRYVEDSPGLPRILLMGDSTSRMAAYETQQFFGFRHLANIHTAPNDCLALNHYEERLEDWLGYCPWDLVQFNIGHRQIEADLTDLESYRNGLIKVIKKIKQHSPQAQIVFATTTPCGFDYWRDKLEEVCGGVETIFQEGVITAFNDVAQEVASEYNVVINDRYTKLIPHLPFLAETCGIKMNDAGHRFVARTDWDVFAQLLSL